MYACGSSALSFCFVFFFSSRRRHTRCSRDWSSDVCSSDLFLAKAELLEVPVVGWGLKSLGVFGVRRGEGDRDALRQARRLARDGNLVAVHLEGTRQRFGHPGRMQPGGLMIALQEGVPVIPCGLDTFGWSPKNRRKCAVVWGEPMRLDGLPRNRRGYAEAAEIVGAEIVRLWRLAAQASADGLPPELPDGARRSGINPKIEPARVAH